MPRLTNHLAIVTCVVLCATMPAQSQTPTTLTWSGGASGAWNTTGTNWTPATTDPWDATNGGSNIAAFGGTATVTVADTIYANGINFTGATTVTGGTIALTGTDPTVTFSTLSTSPARLGSQLSGSGGLTIASSATGINSTNRMFVLEGSESNTFGNLTIRNTNTSGTSAWQFHQLAKTGGAAALSGNLAIDGGSSATNLTVVYLVTASSLPTGATVNLNSDGGYTRFLLNAYATGGSSVEIGGLSSTGTVEANTNVNATWEGGTQPTTTLTINNSSNYAFAGNLQNNVGSGVSPLAIVKNGAGTQTFTGGNTYTGGTTINGGTLRIGSNTGLGSGAVVVNANGTLTLNPGVVATNTITGTGTITVRGSGASFGNLSPGVSGFGGTINVDTTEFWTGITGSVGEYGSATAKWVVDRGATASTFALYPNAANGTVKLGELSGNGAVAGSNTAGTTVFEVGGLGTDSTYGGALRNSTLGGAGAFSRLVKVGSGRLTLSGENSYTGGTTINAGTLALGSATAIGSTGTISFTGGTLQFSASNTTDYSARFSNAANQLYAIDTNGQDVSLGSALTSSGGSLTKSGAGTQILSGENSYSGATTISGGTLQIGAGGATGRLGTGAVTIGSGARLSFNRSGSLAVANEISGNGSLVQFGSGAVSLTGTNSYAGGTTVTAGILGFASQVSVPGWGSPGAVAVAAGGALAVGNDTSPEDAVTAGYLDPASGLGFDTSAGDRTWGTAITGTRPFVKTGANTLTLTAVNNFNSPTTIAAGTLEFQSDSDQTLSGGFSGGGAVRKSGAGTLTLTAAAYTVATVVVDQGTIAFAADVDQTLGGATSGAGRLLKSGTGTLTLSAANTYTGGTEIDAGTITASNLSSFGTGTVNIGASGAARLTASSIGNTPGVTNAVTGSGVLTLAAGAATNQSTIVNYSGDLSGFTGTVRIESGGDFVGITGNYLTGSNARWQVNNSTGSFYLYAGSGTTVAMGELSGNGRIGSHFQTNTTWEVGALGTSSTFSGAFVNAVSPNLGRPILRKVGSGTLTLTGNSSATGFAQELNGGVLALGSPNALSSSGTISFGGGTLQFSSANTTDYSARFSTAADQAYSLDTNGQNVTLGAALSSSGGSLTKLGAGRLTLSNTNSYTGATSVNAGTLAVNGSIAASSGVSVASGATLGGSGFVSAVSGAGRVAPGNSAGILTAPSVDPTTGMGFAFEFGATGSPNYADATASVNDVFHLTGGTPLISSLTSSNAIDVYFNVATLGSGDTFRGGAYIDANVDFLTQVQGATYSYYVLGDGNGPTNGYYTLAQFDPSLSITLATVNDPAAFSGGSQDGRVMEFQAVPEPSMLALLVGGLLGAGTLARRRRAA